MYQDRLKSSEHNEHALKYYECEHSLNMVRERLARIDALVSTKPCKCAHPSGVEKYQEEVNKACADLEALDANLKLINKLSARLTSSNENDEDKQRMSRFVNELREAETRLGQLRAQLPELVRSLTKVHSYVTSIDEGVTLIDNWCADADALIRIEPEHLSLQQLAQQFDRHKVRALL